MASSLLLSQDEIIKRYMAGETSPSLARSFGVSKTRMWYFLNRISKVNMRPPRRGSSCYKYSPEIWKQVVTEYHNGSGASLHSIARKYNICFNTAKSYLQRRQLYKHAWERSIFSPPTDPAQLGYFAGLIDGEGSIVFSPKSTTRKYFKVIIMICNTSPLIIEWLTQFDGRTYWAFRKNEFNPLKHRKPVGQWRIQGVYDCYQLAKAISPYLVLKREKALEMVSHTERLLPSLKSRSTASS